MIALKRLNERSGATWMGAIENITKIDYIVWFLGFFSILFAVKEVIELFSYFKKKFRIKTGKDEDKITLEKRIETLEKHDNWQYNEISKISRGIDDIKERLLNKEIEDMRKTILDFCAALSSGQKFNRESFDYIFKTDENYDKLLTRYGMENNVINESMKFIREKYQEKLRNGEL